MTKKRINISISFDTEKRLKQYALEHHTTVSQAITDWIWSVDIESKNKIEKHENKKLNLDILDEKDKFDFELGDFSGL